MTYRELRILFARIARHDGRLTVLHATDDPLVFPFAIPSGDGEQRSWSVAVRDHLRWLVRNEHAAVCVYTYHWRGLIDDVARAGTGRGTSVLRRDATGWVVAHEHLSALPR